MERKGITAAATNGESCTSSSRFKGGWSNVKFFSSYLVTNNLRPIIRNLPTSFLKLFLTPSRDQPRPILSRNSSSWTAHWTESKPFSFCRSTVSNNTLLVKTIRGMERSHMRLVLSKTLVRGGLALVNEHQFHLQILMIREPFRADFP